MNEFYSIGFYMSDHPLKAYQDYFDKMKVISFAKFNDSPDNNAFVAGTIMSIQEKKTSKGTPYAIVKFSDLKSEFELFLFSDQLILNREKLKGANSFILTLQKETSSNPGFGKRINIKKLVSLDDFLKGDYNKVIIEVENKSDLSELEKLKEDGKTKIEIKVKDIPKFTLFH